MASSRIQVEKLHVFLFDQYSQFPLKQKQQHLIKRLHSIAIFTCPSKSQSAHTKALKESSYFFWTKNIFFLQEKQFSWWSKTWEECCRARCSSHWTGPRRLSAWSRWTRTCCWCPWWWQAARWQGLSDKVLRVECPDTKWHRGESVLPGSSSSSSMLLPRHKSSTVKRGEGGSNDFHLLESASIMSWAISFSDLLIYSNAKPQRSHIIIVKKQR